MNSQNGIAHIFTAYCCYSMSMKQVRVLPLCFLIEWTLDIVIECKTQEKYICVLCHHDNCLIISNTLMHVLHGTVSGCQPPHDLTTGCKLWDLFTAIFVHRLHIAACLQEEQLILVSSIHRQYILSNWLCFQCWPGISSIDGQVQDDAPLMIYIKHYVNAITLTSFSQCWW